MFSRPSECCFQPILTPWCTSSQKQVTHLLCLLLRTQTPADSWQMHPWPVSISRTQSSHLNNLSTVTAHTYEDKCIHTLARSTQRTTPHHTYQSHRVASITALVLTGSWRTLAVVTFETTICLTSQMVKVREAQYFEKKKKCHNRVFFKNTLHFRERFQKRKAPLVTFLICLYDIVWMKEEFPC